MSGGRAQWWRDGLAAGALAAAVLALLWPVLVDGRALFFRDLQIYFVPMREFLAESLRAGVLPFWNPYFLGGTPFLAEIQAGVLYPPSLLLLLADGPRGLGILVAFHLLLGAAGAYFYGRILGLDRLPALAAGAVFGLGGVMASAVNMLNLMQALAWMPVVLAALEADARAPSARRFALAAAAIAMQTLAGAPETSIMTAAVAGARMLVAWRGRGWRWPLRVAGIFALGLALTTPQLVATYELFDQSLRTEGLPDALIGAYSLAPGALASVVLPPRLGVDGWDIFAAYPDGQVPLFLSLYVGWTAAALALLGVALRPRAAWLWLAVGGAGVFLALGAHNPAAFALHEAAAVFRYPEKYVLLAHLALAVLAGLGAQAVAVRFRRHGAVLGAALAGLVIAELVSVNRAVNAYAEPDYYQVSGLPAVQAIERAGPGRIFHRSHYPEGVRSLRPLFDIYRRELAPNVAALAGIGYLNGTEGLYQRSHSVINESLRGLPPSRTLARRLAFFGARYVATRDPAFAASREWRAVARPLAPALWALETRREPVYFPGSVLDWPDALLFRAVDDPRFYTGRAAFASGGGAREAWALAGEVVGHGRPTPNRLWVRVRAQGEALLVWSELYYPGWRVSVDGAAGEVVRVNGLHMGVWVPDGEHRVEFRFVPTGLFGGAAVALAALALVVFLVLRPARRGGARP